jgi:predicted AlkP superfamily pyrophosphatase or phosphodiesterase
MRSIMIFICLFCGGLIAQGADYVIAVSVDGLGSTYLQTLVDAGKLPHFKKLEAESAGTTNARADFNITVTLPNHVSMVTSRRIVHPEGHNWTSNTDPAKGVTIHSQKGAYVSSVFDAVHDHGLRTGAWATKSKFALFKVSYDDLHGAPDKTGPDNGRNKVDCFVYANSPVLTDSVISMMTTQPCHFAFVHFGDGDAAGHSHGWGSESYNDAMITIDGYLGRIMDLIATHPGLKGKTDLIVTADHGGEGKNHADPAKPVDYTIPFFVWGAGVTPGDLYALNASTRQSPGEGRPDYSAVRQPVRNSDLGNLALSLLGLPSIPGSAIDIKQDLGVK